MVISPYVTLWAEGNYYFPGKREGDDELEHFRIDFIKDIVILERGVDMIFGGLNPGQYAKHYIYQNGEHVETFKIECHMDLWEDIAETFGKRATMIQKNVYDSSIQIRIETISSVMRSWVLQHVNECEILSPKRLREEIQRTVLEAYKKYW